MMTGLFHEIIGRLVSIPINIWFLLALMTVPISVFCIKNSQNKWRNGFKWLLTIGLTYIFINLSLHTHRTMERAAYRDCQGRYADGDVQHHLECGTINTADGASNVFYLYAGWLPAMLYLGLWIMIHRAARARNLRSEPSH